MPPLRQTETSKRQNSTPRYLYVFARPCSGCCELLCYSCTGRSRAFHRARGNKRWSSDSDVDENNDDSGADADSEARESNGPGRGAPAARSAEAETISGPSPSIGVEMASGSEGAPVSAAAAGNCQRGGGVSIRGDNWLGIHEAGLLRVAGFHSDCEVVDAHFSSGITATPYCVLVDHNWRCVVVSIRGTMSLEEIVSDLYAEPASMEECGRRWGFDGRDMFAHQVWGRGTAGVDGMFRGGRGGRGRGAFRVVVYTTFCWVGGCIGRVMSDIGVVDLFLQVYNFVIYLLRREKDGER